MFKVIKSYNVTAIERKIIKHMIANAMDRAGTARITCWFDGKTDEGNTVVKAYHRNDDRTWTHIIKIA